MDIPKRLIESINNGQCAIFIGSGISSRLFTKQRKKYPNWNELISALNQWAKDHDLVSDIDYDLISEMITKKNYIISGQILKDKMTKTDFGEFLESIFRNDSIFDHLHDLILDIPFAFCLTTNFDSILESAYMYKYGKTLPTFTPDQIEMANTFFSENKYFLFKLHGSYERSDTITLTMDDYRNLHHQSSYIDLLKNIFLSKTVLFTGFSYSDPDIEFIVSELAYNFKSENRMHYLLVPQNSYNNLEQDYMKNKERITIIEYENSDGSHNGVDLFFNELINKTKKNI